MGLFSKLSGGPDKGLLQNGLPGRGIITDVQLTGTTIQTGNGLVQRTCIFTLEVSLDGKDPYTTTCKQRFPEVQLSQIDLGNTTVCVKANPDNPAEVAIDFDTPPPVVHTAGPAAGHSAAEILAGGTPARAVIVDNRPLGKVNQAGVDVYYFKLTVMPEGKDPYQIEVGNPAPPKALPFLFPGSRVPVKIGSDPNAVVIDWDQAEAESKQ
jgi:hypothetical protein